MLGPIRVLCAGATAFLVCGLGFLPMAAAAPKLSDADDAAIKSAITSCKAEAKAKKIGCGRPSPPELASPPKSPQKAPKGGRFEGGTGAVVVAA